MTWLDERLTCLTMPSRHPQVDGIVCFNKRLPIFSRYWSKMILSYQTIVERYPYLNGAVGASLPGCEIFSLLDKRGKKRKKKKKTTVFMIFSAIYLFGVTHSYLVSKSRNFMFHNVETTSLNFFGKKMRDLQQIFIVWRNSK